jgi:hypothetical protein
MEAFRGSDSSELGFFCFQEKMPQFFFCLCSGNKNSSKEGNPKTFVMKYLYNTMHSDSKEMFNK